MMKILLLLSMLASFSIANSLLMINKGWQLIGSSIPLEDMSEFTEENVEEVWHFDAKTQSWLAYSPDSQIQAKMDKKGITTLSALKNWHGFWVKSKKEWQIVFPDATPGKDTETSKSNDTIILEKGWNLISLPIDTVVSANIFEGLATWKYNDGEWEVSNDEMMNERFPSIAHIKNADGIWVKSDKKRTLSVSEEAAKLHAFKSKKSMEAYITEMANVVNMSWCGTMFFDDQPMMYKEDIPTATNAINDASSTNLQESDVDEGDILKHNGKNIFYLGKNTNGSAPINVTDFDTLTSKKKKILTQIILEDNSSIDSFYLVDDRLVVLSYSYVYRDFSASSENKNIITIFDISDITKIKKLAHYRIDGTLLNSRLIGDSLYVVNRFRPQVSITYPKEYITLSEGCKNYFSDKKVSTLYYESSYSGCYNILTEKDNDQEKFYRYNYNNPQVKIEQLLPKIAGTTIEEQILVSPENLYAPSKLNQTESLITLSKFAIETPSYEKSTGYIGKSHIVYASASSLYLVSSEYPYYMDFSNTMSRSMIYKFSLDDALSYKAIGSVRGTALNQFSLSEHKNILRIATSDGSSWNNNTTNSLTTLKETEGLLKEEGKLTGLGKKGEEIKSVRFMGDKAYLVTFRNTDPLYTIDVSNPSNPKKVGELEVNGYSAYLHPVGEDKILGIGQDADADGRRSGVKIELFDVSDFAYPTSLSHLLLGKKTYSAIEYNHKALAYRGSDMLFAFPYRSYESEAEYLGIYQIKDDILHKYKAVKRDEITGWGEKRGLIFDKNGTSYASFFSNGEIITQKIIKKDD